MTMNISQKPRTSVGFSAISMKTYKNMLKNQGLSENITYTPKGNVLLLRIQSYPTSKDLYANNSSEITQVAVIHNTLTKARQALAKMLNIGDTLKTQEGNPIALVTGRKPDGGKGSFFA